MENTLSDLVDKLEDIKQEKDTKILPGNLKEGVTVFGVTGTLEEGIDTSDATVKSGDIIGPKTAYAKGVKVTGTTVPSYKAAEGIAYGSKPMGTNVMYETYGALRLDISADGLLRIQTLNLNATECVLYDVLTGAELKRFTLNTDIPVWIGECRFNAMQEVDDDGNQIYTMLIAGAHNNTDWGGGRYVRFTYVNGVYTELVNELIYFQQSDCGNYTRVSPNPFRPDMFVARIAFSRNYDQICIFYMKDNQVQMYRQNYTSNSNYYAISCAIDWATIDTFYCDSVQAKLTIGAGTVSNIVYDTNMYGNAGSVGHTDGYCMVSNRLYTGVNEIASALVATIPELPSSNAYSRLWRNGDSKLLIFTLIDSGTKLKIGEFDLDTFTYTLKETQTIAVNRNFYDWSYTSDNWGQKPDIKDKTRIYVSTSQIYIITPVAGNILYKLVTAEGTTLIDTADATATTEDIMTGKTAYISGNKVTGAYVPPAPGATLNVFTQEEEPSTKDGIWVKTSNDLAFDFIRGIDLSFSDFTVTDLTLPIAFNKCQATVINGELWVVATKSVYSYNFDTKVWTQHPDLEFATSCSMFGFGNTLQYDDEYLYLPCPLNESILRVTKYRMENGVQEHKTFSAGTNADPAGLVRCSDGLLYWVGSQVEGTVSEYNIRYRYGMYQLTFETGTSMQKTHVPTTHCYGENVVAVGTNIYLIGAADSVTSSPTTQSKCIYKYDTITDEYTLLYTSDFNIFASSSTLYRNYIICVAQSSRKIFTINLDTDEVTLLDIEVPSGVNYSQLAIYDNKLLIIGGESHTTAVHQSNISLTNLMSDTVYIVNPEMKTDIYVNIIEGVDVKTGISDVVVTNTAGEIDTTVQTYYGDGEEWKQISGPKPTPPYIELEYIESTGTQYIITGISGGSSGAYEIKMNPLSSVAHNYEQYFAGDKDTPAMPKIYNDGIMVAVQGADGQPHKPFAVGDAIHTILCENNQISRDGTIIGSVTMNGWGSSTWWVCNAPEEPTLGASMRLYSLKMWVDGVLSRDYIPVKDSNGVVCLYDKISNNYFYNAGTGDFIAGPETNATE